MLKVYTKLKYMSIVYTEKDCKMERIPKLIKFPVDLVIRIEEYRKKNNIKNFSVAVYELIRKGLEK
jgi:hypothetical protein